MKTEDWKDYIEELQLTPEVIEIMNRIELAGFWENYYEGYDDYEPVDAPGYAPARK